MEGGQAPPLLGKEEELTGKYVSKYITCEHTEITCNISQVVTIESNILL